MLRGVTRLEHQNQRLGSLAGGFGGRAVMRAPPQRVSQFLRWGFGGYMVVLRRPVSDNCHIHG